MSKIVSFVLDVYKYEVFLIPNIFSASKNLNFLEDKGPTPLADMFIKNLSFFRAPFYGARQGYNWGHFERGTNHKYFSSLNKWTICTNKKQWIEDFWPKKDTRKKLSSELTLKDLTPPPPQLNAWLVHSLPCSTMIYLEDQYWDRIYMNEKNKFSLLIGPIFLLRCFPEQNTFFKRLKLK